MVNIYDALPLGKTMIDMRFDLLIHNSKEISDKAINDLKRQYTSIIGGGKSFTQDLVDQVNLDYQTRLQQLEIDSINNTVQPIYGAVVRLFYTGAGSKSITVTGMIFDPLAITSFLPPLNGGITPPLGPMDGNINYRPTIQYTLNQAETLSCTDPNTLTRIMRDYTDMVNLDKTILQKAKAFPIDTTKGLFNVNKVVGATQISPTQCAIQWTESVFDPVTNIPIPIVASDTSVQSIKTFGTSLGSYSISTGSISAGILYISNAPEAGNQQFILTPSDPILNSQLSSLAISKKPINILMENSDSTWRFSMTYSAIVSYNTFMGNIIANQYIFTLTPQLILPVQYSKVTITALLPGITEITRYGLISYKVDRNNWYSPNLLMDLSGFVLYNSPTIPACVFNPTAYIQSTLNRFGSTSGSSIQADFMKNVFKNGAGPVCPTIYPGYLFDANDYSAANGSSTMSTPLIQDYITKMNAGNNPPVKAATTISPLPSPLILNRPLPSKTQLDNGHNVCPTATCEDPDILFSLIDQYNSNPTYAGTILRVTKANTPNSNQCDIEAVLNYDSYIQDIIGQGIIDATTGLTTTTYPMVKKGAVTYSLQGSKTVEGSKAIVGAGSGSSSINTNTIALYVSLDMTNCSYSLIDASGATSGVSVQPNTPLLLQPTDYAKQLLQRRSASLGSAVSKIQSDFSAISGSAKSVLTKYRVNTYKAVGAINTLPCSKKCSDPAILSAIKTYYNAANPNMAMQTILSTGSLDGNSCDATFTNATTTLAGRFTVSVSAAPSCTPTITGMTPIAIANPSTYSDINDLTIKINTAAGSVISPFTDYSPASQEVPPPLKVRAFGLDRARNSVDSFTDLQFLPPRVQSIPIQSEDVSRPSYKFLRFIPRKTRDPMSPSVHVGKFTFFYAGKPLLLDGSATNPMGTWEGSLKAVTGPGPRDGWYDAHKKPLVFAFKSAISVDAYSLTTSAESYDADPVSWRLEGSTNGTFWTALDTQTNFPTPIERFRDIVPAIVLYRT